MKILCLHGIGTNNKIFKLQTAAFRYELGDQHTYEFVQGIVPWQLPKELEALSNASDQHYSYYDNTSTPSFIAALDSLEAYVEAEGPFDGVMAYSQGAGLVAMLLVRRQYLRPDLAPLFRCAILFSPGHVFDPLTYLDTGEVKVLEQIPGGMSGLSLPIVIVYGEDDQLKEGCEKFARLCNADTLSVFVHEGGHEVPGLGAKKGLLGAVKMARRGVTHAELANVA